MTERQTLNFASKNTDTRRPIYWLFTLIMQPHFTLAFYSLTIYLNKRFTLGFQCGNGERMPKVSLILFNSGDSANHLVGFSIRGDKGMHKTITSLCKSGNHEVSSAGFPIGKVRH